MNSVNHLWVLVNIGNRFQVWLASHGRCSDIIVDVHVRLLVTDQVKLARLVVTDTNPDSPGTADGLQVSLGISSFDNNTNDNSKT